jgi:metal-sulfur cluster biosynthetic enzyme
MSDIRTDAAPAVSPATAAAGSETLKASEEMIRDALAEVYDPEIGIDIVSLGLIYGTEVDDVGLLTVDMTLTSPFCPLGSILQAQIHAVCATLPGVDDVRVNLVWVPPWDPRTMASDEARLELGIY